jgi:hypothetical protein
VASDDYLQISTIIHRLEQLAGLLDPFHLVEAVAGAIAVTVQQIPGDPAEIRALGQAYRTTSGGTGTIVEDIHTLAAQGLPEIWKGETADTAQRIMFGVGELMSNVKPVFADLAAALDGYADTVERLQKRHSGLLQGLNLVYYVVEWLFLGLLTAVAVGAIFAGVTAAEFLRLLVIWAVAFHILVKDFVALYNECLAAADALLTRLSDARAKAAAGGAVKSGMAPAAAVVLATTTFDAKDPGNGNTILNAAQLDRATKLMAALSPQDRKALDAALAATRSPAEEAYILKALLAGHSVAEVTGFADAIRGKYVGWLREHLSIIDPSQPLDEVRYQGVLVRQQDDTSCGPMTVVAARAMSDPMYAFSLTTDGHGNSLNGADFAKRVADEENALRGTTNVLWPDKWGTTPEGVVDGMNQYAGAFGTEYTSRWVDDTDPRSVEPALRDAVSAMDAGHPVTVLVTPGLDHMGNGAFHYLVLVGHHDGKLTFYDPTATVFELSDADFLNGTMRLPGTEQTAPHIQAVVLPGS